MDAGGERGPMNFQYPIDYGAFTPCAPAGRGGRGGATAPAPPPNPNCPPGMENGFEKDFAVVWPSPELGHAGWDRPHADASAEPESLHRDDRPSDRPRRRAAEDLKGDLLFAEPVGR